MELVVGPLQAGRLLFELDPQSPQFQLRLNAGEQFLDLERLRNEVHRPQLQALYPLDHFRDRTEENDGEVASLRPRLELPINLEPAHARHADVQENQLRQPGCDGSQRLLSATR